MVTQWYINCKYIWKKEKCLMMGKPRPLVRSVATWAITPGVVSSNPCSANIISDVKQKSLRQALFLFHHWDYSCLACNMTGHYQWYRHYWGHCRRRRLKTLQSKNAQNLQMLNGSHYFPIYLDVTIYFDILKADYSLPFSSYRRIFTPLYQLIF